MKTPSRLRKSPSQKSAQPPPLKMTPMKMGLKRVVCEQDIELTKKDLAEINQSLIVTKQKSHSVMPARQAKLEFAGRLNFT